MKGEIVHRKISVNIPFPGVVILYHQPNRNFNAPFKISPYKHVHQSSLIFPPPQKKRKCSWSHLFFRIPSGPNHHISSTKIFFWNKEVPFPFQKATWNGGFVVISWPNNIPGTWWPSIEINGWLSIGWWTKPLHRKWSDITISIHYKMVGFRGSRHLWFQHVSTNQKRKQADRYAQNIFGQKKSDGLQVLVQNFSLRRHSKTLAQIRFFRTHIASTNRHPLCHLPRSDVPPAPRRAALAREAPAPNPLAALLAWRRANKTGGSHPRVGKNKVSSLKKKKRFSHLNMDRLEYDRFDWKGCCWPIFKGPLFQGGYILRSTPPRPLTVTNECLGWGSLLKME